jgi:Ca-activated chloride channel homolog
LAGSGLLTVLKSEQEFGVRAWVLASVFSVLCVAGQAPPAPTAAVSYRADATLVLIPVSVTDASNRYVLGLEKNNFRLFEDGVEQTIEHFSSEDTPLSVGLIVDTSGSMGGKLDTSRQAAKEFLKTLNSSDEAFLVEFSDAAHLEAHFTQDTGEIERRLNSATSAGLTALLDAVHIGLEEMKHARNPRKALLIISDGGDNNSRYRPAEIENLVREADVQIYAMGIFEPFLDFGLTAAEIGGPRLLSEIAEQTGGRALAATDASNLAAVADRIGLELRNQYVIAYSPADPSHDGKYRHVEVKLRAPESLPALKARWRLGYYAPAR